MWHTGVARLSTCQQQMVTLTKGKEGGRTDPTILTRSPAENQAIKVLQRRGDGVSEVGGVGGGVLGSLGVGGTGVGVQAGGLISYQCF